MNEIIIGDKVYISAKRAAEITGYARDYVGQLCREGHIEAKMVGRSWYVFEPSIRAHRFGPEAVEEAKVPREEAAEENAAVQQEPEAVSDWQNPVYSAETPDLLPELKPADLEELLPPAEETLTDMQAAWKEWFDEKQKALETPEIESPEVIEARNAEADAETEPIELETEEVEEVAEEDEEPVSIPLQRIEEEEPVQIHTIQTPRIEVHHDVVPVSEPEYSQARYIPEYAAPQAPEGRVIAERVITRPASGAKRKAPRTNGTNAPIVAVLIGISLVSVTVAAIGTGYATKYLRTLPAENNPVIKFLVGTRTFNR